MVGKGSALALGHEALAASAWEKARAAFEKALRDGESPQAQEGLSWAAWWLNDGAATIAAREAAYRLYWQAGELAAAARMAMWLASDYDDFRGELPIARGWRQRARRLLNDHPPCPEHGWLSILEGDAAILIEDDMTTARRCAEEAVLAARRCGGVVDIEILALAMEGLALVGEGNVDEGMKRLDEAAASVMGGEIEDDAWANKILCYLIYGCERVRDFDRAAQWCDKLRLVADRMELAFAQGTCRAHYGSVLMSYGRWEEAEEQLAKSAEYLAVSRLPWVAEALVRLAELRRRQGRLDEAVELLRRAGRHPLALLGRAEIALDTGRLADAEELVERFLRHLPEASWIQRAPALELLVRITALSGKRDRAAAALADLQGISEAARSPPLRAATCFSAAMMAVSSGDYERARASLEDAAVLFDHSRTPYESARARLELAAVLVSLDRLDRAGEEAGLAYVALKHLGASFSAARAAALLKDVDRRLAPIAGPASPLTGRQIEILRLISKGRNDREIAAALGLSEHTVHRHVANILTRLDMPTRAAAAAHAATHRLI